MNGHRVLVLPNPSKTQEKMSTGIEPQRFLKAVAQPSTVPQLLLKWVFLA